MSPMQRTLKRLRDDGWTCAITEHWNAHSRTKTDLWGFCDVLAIKRDIVMAVQTTSYANISARVKKITESPLVAKVREAGVIITVEGWRKNAQGKWTSRIVDCS